MRQLIQHGLGYVRSNDGSKLFALFRPTLNEELLAWRARFLASRVELDAETILEPVTDHHDLCF